MQRTFHMRKTFPHQSLVTTVIKNIWIWMNLGMILTESESGDDSTGSESDDDSTESESGDDDNSLRMFGMI